MSEASVQARREFDVVVVGAGAVGENAADRAARTGLSVAIAEWLSVDVLVVRALFLMAPAFYVPGYEQYVPPAPACPVTLVHGWRDDVVPWEGSVRYAATCRAQLTLLDGDHRLTANLPELSRLFGWFLGDVEEAAR